MNRLEISTLWELQVRIDGQNRDLGSRKQRALPTLLVVNRRRSVPALADRFDATEISVRDAIAPNAFRSAWKRGAAMDADAAATATDWALGDAVADGS
jgi:hypothetical protein